MARSPQSQRNVWTCLPDRGSRIGYSGDIALPHRAQLGGGGFLDSGCVAMGASVSNSTQQVGPVPDLGTVIGLSHGLLNLVREDAEMPSQRVERLALHRVGGKVADQGSLSRFLTKFVDRGLIVFHGRPRARYEGP